MSSVASKPKISIITACFNAADDLALTFSSLSNIRYENIEHIVIDGASVDHTMQVIQSHQKNIAYWISEPDVGIADAWNKGLRQATGDYICFLNAGDEYHEDFIIEHLNAIKDNELQISYGITYLLDNSKVINKVDVDFNPGCVDDGFGFLHTSVFTSKKVYELVGDFSLDYKIAIDADWLLRAHKLGVKFVRCKAMNYMALGGVSDKHRKKAQTEYLKALEKHQFINGLSDRLRLKIRYSLLNTLASLNLFYYRRRLRTQYIFIALKILNLLHNNLPTFWLRSILHKIAGFGIHATATVHSGGEFFSFKRLSVGEGTVINKNFRVDNRMGITIGQHVSIAHDVSIYTLGHDIKCDAFCTKGAAVKINNYAVIFAGARIMPGVVIGEGAVVYPGAVVMESVPAMDVVAGNPARKIRTRKNRLSYRLEYDYWFGH